MRRRPLVLFACAALAAGGVAGCGGGNDDVAPQPASTPEITPPTGEVPTATSAEDAETTTSTTATTDTSTTPAADAGSSSGASGGSATPAPAPSGEAATPAPAPQSDGQGGATPQTGGTQQQQPSGDSQGGAQFDESSEFCQNNPGAC